MDLQDQHDSNTEGSTSASDMSEINETIDDLADESFDESESDEEGEEDTYNINKNRKENILRNTIGWQGLLDILATNEINNYVVNCVKNARKIYELTTEDKKEELELEIRIRGLTEHAFEKIDFFDEKPENYTIRIHKIKGKEGVYLRHISDQQQKLEIKEKIWNRRIHRNVGIFLSMERPYAYTYNNERQEEIEKSLKNKGYYLKLMRNITRWKAKVGPVRMEKSIVKTTRVANQNEKTSYELEIEILLDSPSGGELTQKDFDHIKVFIASALVPGALIRTVPKTINDLIPSIKIVDPHKNKRSKFPKPVNLSLRKVLYGFEKGSVSVKADGIRVFVLMGLHGTFLITISSEVLVGSFNRSKEFYLADAELIGDKVYVFDIMVYANKSLVNEPLEKRVSFLENFCEIAGMNLSEKTFFPKRHWFFNDYESFVRLTSRLNSRLLENKKNKVFNKDLLRSDGLIFTSSKGYNEKIYKCKWLDTVDFQYEERQLKLMSNGELVDSGFELDQDVEEGSIIECSIDPYTRNASLIKIREDRYFPNSEKVMSSIIEVVKGKKGITALIENSAGVTLMRAYHNDIKRKLVKGLKGVLIDVGTGRGGDLSKWGGLEKVYCIEPETKNLKIIIKRLNEMMVSAVEIEIVPSKSTILSDRNRFNANSIDAITCFFCLNLMTVSEQNRLLLDASELLVKEGVIIFIAITKERAHKVFSIDQRIVRKRYEMSMISDEYYMVDIPGTFVTRQEERLVDTYDLTEKAMEYGLIRHSESRSNVNPFCKEQTKNLFMSNDEKEFSDFFEVICFKKP